MPVVYLLRHGEAKPPTSTRSDRERQLTSQGRKDILLQAELLYQEHPGPLRIVHSPYLRAWETAELVNRLYKTSLEVMPELTPSGSATAVVSWTLGIEEDLLLVTHLPLIAEIAAILVSKRLPFFPGTCAGIERADAFVEKGKLGWFRHPE